MRERALAAVVLAGMLVLALPRCGYRSAGLEVTIAVQAASGTPAGTLDLDSLSLVPCEDVPARAARAFEEIGVAHAHDLVASHATRLALPGGIDARTIAVMPGAYCGVRLRLGSAERVALELETGVADWREVVLPLLDASSAPIRVTLTRAGEAADIAITLGTYSDGDTPERALDHIVDRAVATARMRDPGTTR